MEYSGISTVATAYVDEHFSSVACSTILTNTPSLYVIPERPNAVKPGRKADTDQTLKKTQMTPVKSGSKVNNQQIKGKQYLLLILHSVCLLKQYIKILSF